MNHLTPVLPFMVNAEAQNPHTFWHYKNPTANCQVFVTMRLTGNRSYFVVSPELLSFVNQDAYSLLAKTPELSKYAQNSAPSLAARLDVLLHGAGVDKV